nr:hypothetical protein BaRGS_010080 [Batillaria attramentaria]
MSCPLIFFQENWKPDVSFLVGNRVDDYKHIDILSATINTGIRKLFTVVTKDSLYNEVRELGNPKVKKGKDAPLNFEICEPCKTHLDAGEDIPLPLLAKLIKYRLLTLKAADMKRREAEKKAAADKLKAAKDKAAGKDAGRKPSGKKGGKKTPEPQAAKDGSKMKKRGEDDGENKFIDDEPDDGAHMYVVVVGFNNPNLLQFLADLNVTASCIIRITSQDYSRFLPPPPLPDAPEKDEKTLAAEEAVRVERQKLALELRTFWKDVLHLLRNNPDSSKLHDIARLDYEVKSLLLPSNYDDIEQKTQFGTAMFEDVACMIYDLQDARRLYNTYLQNLKLVSASQVLESSIPELVVPPDMRCYNDMMNSVPQESMSVCLVLHCMLEQVVATEENREPPKIDRAFKQFVFECQDLAATDPNGFIVTRDIEGLEHTPIPWDDPYPFFKVHFEVPEGHKFAMEEAADAVLSKQESEEVVKSVEDSLMEVVEAQQRILDQWNYLEYVAESIAEWLKEKEAEYQAHLLQQEVEKIRQDDEVEAKVEEKEKEEKKPQSRGSAKSRTPEPHTEDQQQQDVIPEDLEPYWPFTGYDTGNLLLHASGILTTLFPSDGGQIRTERTEFVQGSTTVKTTVLKDGHVFAVHIVNPREEPEEEYDPDLDPSGTAAKAEATEKADLEKPEKEMSQTESAERTAEEDGEKKEEEKDKKPLPVSQFGSIAATLCDGMVISLSQWGATGETAEGYKPEIYKPPISGKPYEPAPYVPPASSPSPQPQTASPTKGKKDKKGAQPTPEPPPVEEEPQVVETPEEILFEQPFQEVFVTCPDGLNVRYFLQSSVGVNPESPEDRHLVVKQSYPFKTAGLQDLAAGDELSDNSDEPRQGEKKLARSTRSLWQKFGTNVGQGLSVGGAVKMQQRIPILKCPSALELRQFVQYKPMNEQLRAKLGNVMHESWPEEADGRSMLRSKKIPSYFDSELGKAFLLTQAKDMDELLKELSEDPRRDGTEALKNTGVDSCRFKVRQPPPATGLRVIYRPGAVAAGMKAELRLELYAIAVGVEGESGVADEYDNRSQDSPTISRAPGVVLISNTPPASTGIIRPRKDLAIGQYTCSPLFDPKRDKAQDSSPD